MTMREHLREAPIDLEGDPLAQAAGLVGQVTMDLEVAQRIGAAKHGRTPTRETKRDGYSARSWATGARGEFRCASRSY